MGKLSYDKNLTFSKELNKNLRSSCGPIWNWKTW